MPGIEYNFRRPNLDVELSDEAEVVLGMGALASQLAMENRTSCVHPDGRLENVAEHTLMLAKVALAYVSEFHPELDRARVLGFALVHDDVEAYVGDTFTLGINDEEAAQKSLREKAGIARLASEHAPDMPAYVELVEAYEEQCEPEARFVRVLDKAMTSLIHIPNGGEVQRTFSEDYLLQQHDLKLRKLRDEYPDMHNLIDVVDEVFLYVVSLTFDREESEDRQLLLFEPQLYR